MRQDPINLARDWQGGRGFTLIEILIVVVILGVLGWVVLPRFSDASNTTRENTLKDDLRYTRTQIIVFKAQHGNTAPGYPCGKTTASPTEQDFLLQMTGHTDEFCNIARSSTAKRWGPYLKKMPVNPLNGLSTILIVPNGSSMPPAGLPDNTTGWIYKPQTLELIPNTPGNDSEGTPYVEY
jgi:prepilin-type N-terminal cleavage/methylation domain-containing protein